MKVCRWEREGSNDNYVIVSKIKKLTLWISWKSNDDVYFEVKIFLHNFLLLFPPTLYI